MSESKDEFKKNENRKSIIAQENKLSRDTPALVNFSCYGQCPMCGNYVHGPEEHYCSNCGQALLWPSYSNNSKEDSLEGRKTDHSDLTEETEEQDEQDAEQQSLDDLNDGESSLFGDQFIKGW